LDSKQRMVLSRKLAFSPGRVPRRMEDSNSTPPKQVLHQCERRLDEVQESMSCCTTNMEAWKQSSEIRIEGEIE